MLVTVPRDRFNATLRKRLQALFRERYETTTVDYRLSLGETGDARIHFTVWLEGPVPMVPFDELEAEVLALARTWEDRLRSALSSVVGAESARSLAERWSDRFPEYYRISTPLPMVAGDVMALDRLSRSGTRLSVGLQNEGAEGERLTRIAVYRLDGKLDLSAMLPLLEHMGLRVIEEVPTRLLGDDGDVFIHDIGVLGPDGRQLEIEQCGDRVAATLTAALLGSTESDSLHRLIVASDLDHEQIGILRAYRTYWRLVTPSFSLRYINDAFAENPEIAAKLVDLFAARFGSEADAATEAALRAEILDDLDAVASLDQDRILRGFAGLIEATMRTNAYRPERSSLSFKLRSALVPEMPEPTPMFEIFVSAPHVEGVHLRGSRIARGGIRWSTRREDYRTEVLGLMKAQMTKNAVIVPSGAKGGFVLRGGDQSPEAVRAAYETFIRGLLDLTDNRVSGEIVPPVGVRFMMNPIPTWSLPRIGERPRFPTSPTRSRRNTASGSAMPSRPAAPTATTTRRWESLPGERGNRSGATFSSSGSTSMRRPSPWWESVTCRGTSSATGCCFPRICVSWLPSITATCSSIPIRIRRSRMGSVGVCSTNPALRGATTTERCCPRAVGSGTARRSGSSSRPKRERLSASNSAS